mmetsp:Transcript_45133/g.101902  ORF Transcript_45133/g.101902 Transcript_45133/m.101902 type:complete len:207 (+) Transcript_45133:24-644(+)
MASIDLTDDQEAKDAIKAGATRLEFEGAKDLHYGLVQKTVRPYGKVMMAKVNPPDDSWVEFKTAEMCAKAARAMDASRFEPGQDGVEGSKGQWFATFKEGEPVPDPYAKKQDRSRSRSKGKEDRRRRSPTPERRRRRSPSFDRRRRRSPSPDRRRRRTPSESRSRSRDRGRRRSDSRSKSREKDRSRSRSRGHSGSRDGSRDRGRD